MLRNDDFSQDYMDLWARHYVEQVDEPQIEPDHETQYERLARQRLRHTRYLYGLLVVAVAVGAAGWWL